MADTLEVPYDAGSLVLASGNDVNPNRPLYTGDVIAGVVLPVLQTDPLAVVIVSHPCSMRAGPTLLEHLHVAPVVAHSESGPQMWRGNFKLMALDAVAESVGLTNPVVRLDRMTLVQTSEAQSAPRVACLDRAGVNILRQRLIHDLTRHVVNVTVLDVEASGAHEEVDLMEEWIDAAVTAGVEVAQAEADFHSWLQGDARQSLLGSPSTASTVRRAARGEMGQRYSL